MNNNKRHQALLFIYLETIGMIILGISLPDLRLQSGLPMPGAVTSLTATQTIQKESGPPGIAFPWILQVGLAMGIILMFIALVTALVKKANIKQIGLFAGGFAVLFGILSCLPHLATSQLDLIPTDSNIPLQPSFEYNISPISDPPAGFLRVAAVLLLIGLVVVGWLLSHTFRRSRKEDPLTVEVEAAVQAIANGQSLSDVIIRCYLNMESVIAQEQGIERGLSVTPREFEFSLVEKGIPKYPILELTSLFEKARYGNQRLNEKDEQMAVNCLTAIRNACRTDLGGTRCNYPGVRSLSPWGCW